MCHSETAVLNKKSRVSKFNEKFMEQKELRAQVILIRLSQDTPTQLNYLIQPLRRTAFRELWPMKKLAVLIVGAVFAGTTTPLKPLISPNAFIAFSIASCLAGRQLDETCISRTFLVDLGLSWYGAYGAHALWNHTHYTPYTRGTDNALIRGEPFTINKKIQFLLKTCALIYIIAGQNGSNLPRALSTLSKYWEKGFQGTPREESVELFVRLAGPLMLLILSPYGNVTEPTHPPH